MALNITRLDDETDCPDPIVRGAGVPGDGLVAVLGDGTRDYTAKNNAFLSPGADGDRRDAPPTPGRSPSTAG
jgi:hypothetical protein